MPEDYFGERVAERYDERYADLSDPAVVDPIVAFLADLARDGAALELGIGTGRIALPLAQRGVRVHGIDLSEAMVARLRAKPGAEQIGVTIGDCSTTTVEDAFSVAYLVANTIMNLTTQDEQVACFRNAAAHLEPGGCFVIEPRYEHLDDEAAAWLEMRCGVPEAGDLLVLRRQVHDRVGDEVGDRERVFDRCCGEIADR